MRTYYIFHTLVATRIRIMKSLLFFFSLTSAVQFSEGNTVNVLMMPLGTTFNSHFLNFDKIADILQVHGYNVSILVTSDMKPLMKARNVTFMKHGFLRKIPFRLILIQSFWKDT